MGHRATKQQSNFDLLCNNVKGILTCIPPQPDLVAATLLTDCWLESMKSTMLENCVPGVIAVKKPLFALEEASATF